MLHGKIVVIKRTGADGAQFPLTADTCVFGRYGLLIIKIIYQGIKIFLGGCFFTILLHFHFKKNRFNFLCVKP